jgi:hypothetical protein
MFLDAFSEPIRRLVMTMQIASRNKICAFGLRVFECYFRFGNELSAIGRSPTRTTPWTNPSPALSETFRPWSGSRDSLRSRFLDSGRYEADSVETFIGSDPESAAPSLLCRYQNRAGTTGGQRAALKLSRG